MISRLIANTLYVKVFKNRFELRHIESATRHTVTSLTAFTTNRLLVGQFTEADASLRKGMRELLKGRWRATKPIIVIQPMEMIEGGLSQIEERIFHELADSVDVRRSLVWVGQELSDSEVLKKVSDI